MRSSHPMHVYPTVSRSENLPLLETLIETVGAHPLEKRMRQVTTQPIRMEDPLPPDEKFKQVWRLSFLKFRAEGFGRVSPNRAAESIPLADGESFSEDTAALYDPDSKTLVVQYNHSLNSIKSLRGHGGRFKIYCDVWSL